MSISLKIQEENCIERLPDGVSLELVKVPGGTFRMGSDEHKFEQLIHQVNVPAFYIGIYPITNIQFAAFLNAYGSETVKQGQYSGQRIIDKHEWSIQKVGNKWLPSEGYEHHPVVNVSWYGAKEYCNWLSELTDKPYRLSSESEWEYAAREGQESPGFRYSGGNKLKEVGWYWSNSHGETKPVGLKLPNELGIHDMSGNVWEWCADHWHEDYKEAPSDGSVWVSSGDTETRVVRGGSWDGDDFICRVSSRYGLYANVRLSLLGFRVARY